MLYTTLQRMETPMKSSYRLPYRSKFEIRLAADLGKKNVSFDYELSTFQYTPKIRSYTPDFYLPDFKFTPIDQGIQKTVRWFIDNYSQIRK